MNALLQDLRYAFRALRLNAGFAVVAVVTLALGIGSATAIFSVVDAVLLRPLPYRDADRLAVVSSDMRQRNVTDFPIAPADFGDMRRQLTAFDQIAGLQTFRTPVSGNDVPPEQVAGAAVTPNLFHLLGMRVEHGRDFQDDDATPQPALPPGTVPGTAAPAATPLPTIAILGHDFWVRRFGADTGIIGKSVDLGGAQAAQVVGVLAPGAELLFPPAAGVERRPAVWVAMRADLDNGSRINVFLRVIGHLRPGASLALARNQLEVLGADLRARFPIKQTAGVYFRAEPMHEDLVAEVRPAILALMGAVVFVLLIACANVANLLLVRASQRGHELAVRAALGAGRRRLVGQMLAESLLLAGAGAVAGVLVARAGIGALLALGPADLPRLDDVAIDPLVLGFAILASLAAAVAFGVAPALRASQAEAADALRAGGRSVGRRAGHRLAGAVVVAEVSLSFVLLVGSGLMVRSFRALQSADPGYVPQGVATFLLTNLRATTPEERRARTQAVQEALARIPGVQATSAAFPFPLDGRTANVRWGTEAAAADPALFQQADLHIVRLGYLETLRTPVLQGRAFTAGDQDTSAHHVIVDRLLAAKAFPGRSAVGQRLLIRVNRNDAEWFDVIGVAGHQRHAGLATDGREGLYLADGFFGGGVADRWALRTTGDPALLGPAIREAVRGVDPRLLVAELQPFTTLVEQAGAQTRFALVLIGVFAVVAVLLASVGLYGVLATMVRERHTEIGVRLAFGAPPAGILRLIVGQGLRLSVAGIGVGAIAALGLTRVMRHMLVGVSPTDPLTFVTIAALFLVIVCVASWLPAHRAAATDPMIALRKD